MGKPDSQDPSNDTTGLPVFTYISDRGFEDAPKFLRLPALPSPIATAELMDAWTRLSGTRSQAQAKSPEWRSLQRAYIRHLEWRFDYPSRLARQQATFAWLVTCLVIVLVLAGLVFSFLQLNYALAVGRVAELSTQVDIQAVGRLSLRSSVVGATVLLTSLAFFYLYLRYIFAQKPALPPHVAISETDALRLFASPQKRNRAVERQKAGETVDPS